MKCEECGTKFEKKALFCAKCGSMKPVIVRYGKFPRYTKKNWANFVVGNHPDKVGLLSIEGNILKISRKRVLHRGERKRFITDIEYVEYEGRSMGSYQMRVYQKDNYYEIWSKDEAIEGVFKNLQTQLSGD